MWLLNYLMAPSDSEAGGDSVDNKEDAIKFFEEDNEEESEVIQLDKSTKERVDKSKEKDKEEGEEEVEDKDKEDEEEDEEVDELDELESELEEPDDEKLELVSPVQRKEILSKYPKLFKDFPYLEKAYYRERAFTELLPTIDDAKVAVKKSQTLDNFERELSAGKTETILKVVKQNNEDAFFKLVDDYLPTLAKVDEKAFYHVIGNVIKDTIVSMVKEGKTGKDDKLIEAASQLNQFIFGTKEFIPPEKLAKEKQEEPEDENLKRKQHEFFRRQFETARDGLNTKVDSILQKTIQANIDPRESMTEYVKRNASREALENVVEIINKDSRFKQLLDKLWERAARDDFKDESLAKIKSAYLSKARTLLPSVLKKARNEALKGMGKRVKEEETKEVENEPEESTPRKKRETTPSSNRGQKSDRDRAREIPEHVSTRDYLMQD